ncbi:MAG: GNAT family N-acetyltransferase [Bacteroidetes bacterium]|nr:GNAT family N-acetyltransferase [Bacteroidota bacterium]
MNSNISYRTIEPNDNKVIAELIRTVFREFKIDIPGTVYTDPTTDNLFLLFQKKGSIYWLAEEKGILLGGCGIFPTNGLPDGYAELVKFYVRAESRGKGIGKMLMEKNIQWASEYGYTHLYLESFPELNNAVRMYEHSGFSKIEHALGSSGHFACTLWMVKKL